MKKISKIVVCSIFLLSILINLCGCKKTEDENVLKQKINTEISYIDSELVSILNALNNINYSKYKVMTQEVESTTGNNNSGESGGGGQQQQSEGQQQGRSREFKQTIK